MQKDLIEFIITHLGGYDDSKCPDKYFEAVSDLIWSELQGTEVDPYK